MTKKIFLVACAALGAMWSCNNEPAKPKAFVHATYHVAGALKSEQEIRSSNYAQFPFIYLMAEPRWVATDFDQPIDSVLKKYVVDFAYPQGDSGRALTEVLIDEIHKQGSKVLVSFSGTTFDSIAMDPNRMAKYARMMAQFAKKYNYDGVELDWEHTVTIPMHTAFMKVLRAELDSVQKETNQTMHLTSALNTSHRYTPEQAQEVSKYVDWLNVMCYDFGGGIWDSVATHNTPFASIKRAMEKWDVFAPEKISLGIASYGFIYNGVKPGEQIASGKTLKDYGRYFDYTELPALIEQGWTAQFDTAQQVNYFFSPDGNSFVTIETPETVMEKVKWALNDKHYQGIFWWVWKSDFMPAQGGAQYGTHYLMDPVEGYLTEQGV